MFTRQPLVHTLNPDFLRWRLWLGFLEPLKFHSRRSSLIKTPELRIPEIHGSITSWISPDSSHPETNNRIAKKAKFSNYFMKYSKISDSREIQQDIFCEHILVMNLEFPFFRHTHECFHVFGNSDGYEGDRFLPNSLTLAPLGSGLTPTIRFHENSRNSVKNFTLGTSEWTCVSLKTRNGCIEAVPRGYPLPSYK
jgi:hypothetical protein